MLVNHPNSFFSIEQFDKDKILALFKETNVLLENNVRYLSDKLEKKNIALLFFQPSTRTRMSFEMAAKNNGYLTILESDPVKSSSIAKGETLYDTLKTISNYVDAIVIRHPDKNIVENNIKNINVPIINGGLGTWEHPTQSLIDFFTFQRHLKKPLNRVKLAIVGDLNTRTAQSVIKLGSKFGVTFKMINHTSYPIEKDRLEYYQQLTSNISFISVDNNNDFREQVKDVDIVYYSNYIGTHCDETRVNMFNSFYLPLSFLRDVFNHSGHLIHTYSPLPRRKEEMDVEVDDTVFDLSFPAIKYSVSLRQVLLKNILEN